MQQFHGLNSARPEHVHCVAPVSQENPYNLGRGNSIVVECIICLQKVQGCLPVVVGSKVKRSGCREEEEMPACVMDLPPYHYFSLNICLGHVLINASINVAVG